MGATCFSAIWCFTEYLDKAVIQVMSYQKSKDEQDKIHAQVLV